MSEKIYAERDIIGMDSKGGYYCRHISAMTREGLHSKSDIAAELGFRDMVIAELEAKCTSLAAENAALKAFGGKLGDMHNDLNGEGTGIHGRAEVAIQQVALQAAIEEFDAINTPDTDAFLAEVRAQGVEMFSDSLLCPDLDDTIRDFAAQLRQEANTAELVAAGIITKAGE